MALPKARARAGMAVSMTTRISGFDPLHKGKVVDGVNARRATRGNERRHVLLVIILEGLGATEHALEHFYIIFGTKRSTSVDGSQSATA